MIEWVWLYVGLVLYTFIGVIVEGRWYRMPVGLKACIVFLWPLALLEALIANYDSKR